MIPPSSDPRSVPELLSPAGNWDCARAAVANGADAIYFGLDSGFNARARAANFALDDLPRLMDFLHGHRVAGYVAINILAFSDELAAVEETVRRIAESGADAVLVQDLGLLRLIREVTPDLPIHASTQMSLTSAEGINVVQRLGIDRVVLARELSVREIAMIRRQTTVPLEVFVHGALCVAYSGQCLTSESLGGRSANRGQCAQACRLPYEVVCDGQDVDLGDRQYLLSPQDLAAYALIPDLIAAGVSGLKIEGRLKTPEYVANITRHYREAIDVAVTGAAVTFTPRQIEEMELSFSRGFSVGWLHGCDHKALVPATSSAKRGVLVGTVRGVRKGRVCVELARSLKAGDGVVLEGNRAAGEEQGGRIFRLFRAGRPVTEEVAAGQVEVTFHDRSVDLRQLWPGQKVWKNDDPTLSRRLRKSFTGDIQGRNLPIDVAVHARIGHPLQIMVQAAGCAAFPVQDDTPLVEAVKHPLTAEGLQRQLGRLGGSGFVLRSLTASITGSLMVPLSVLGRLRREMVAGLAAQRSTQTPPRRHVNPMPVLPRLRQALERSTESTADPQLVALCRSLSQLRMLLEHELSAIYVDFQDIREYRQAVALARAAQARIYLATPRVQKPGELGIFHALARHQADGMLVRNLAGLEFFASRGVPCVADYALNAANELTVEYLRRQGAQRVTASYDLNRDQLMELARHTLVDRLEVVIHQYMPMFHMEHCVFCAVLSPGSNKTNCGRPCDRHVVRLRDRVGSEHPLQADVGCRNTLFNGTPQSGAEVVAPLLRLGVRHFRLELLHDDPAPRLRRCLDLYRDLLRGRISGREVWTALQATNRTGVTRGTLEHRRDPLAIL